MKIVFLQTPVLISSTVSCILAGILLKLKAMQDNVDWAADTDVRLMKNVAITRRIGFAEVILPGLHILLLYLQLLLLFKIYNHLPDIVMA